MWTVEETAVGRIVVPPGVPPGVALFYTSIDHPGALAAASVAAFQGVLRARFGVNAVLTTCRQVHGATVVRGERLPSWKECDDCDALWSAERTVALGIKVADCLPITMVDPVHHVIANAHSGWRGAVRQIAAVTADAAAEGGFDPASASVWLGPSIRACCFEVGDEVVAEFAAVYGEVESYVDRTGDRPHLDLVAITRDLLVSRGFAAERVFDSGLCTRCDSSIFHSYRRTGAGGGRNLAIVAH